MRNQPPTVSGGNTDSDTRDSDGDTRSRGDSDSADGPSNTDTSGSSGSLGSSNSSGGGATRNSPPAVSQQNTGTGDFTGDFTGSDLPPPYSVGDPPRTAA